MKKNKEYFKNKSAAQIYSLCLLIACITLMMICVIARLCGILWFAADLTFISKPDKIIMEIIMGCLLTFELTFTYKILCRKSWTYCFIIAILETLLGILISYLLKDLEFSNVIVNIFYAICHFIIPLISVKNLTVIIDSIILYVLCMLYGFLFMAGRIGGGINVDNAYNFIYNVLGIIDYKLFIVSLYLIIKYFGGIKIWKNQKRLIFQVDLRKK